MRYTITDPRGIDASIAQLQEVLYQRLCAKWGLTDNDYDCYARCYRNQEKDGYLPLVFKGGKDYSEAFASDKTAVQSFFGVSERRKVEEDRQLTTDVHLIFFMNIVKVCELAGYSYAHRADEELKAHVYEILRNPGYGFTTTEMITGVNQVLSDYPGSRREGLKYSDMHPHHYFRINFSLTYDPDNCVLPPISQVIG